MGAVAAIAWESWKPTDTATLLFAITGGRILLIVKKRGLGAGKVNGPGGRLEPGERPEEAAVREVQEELGVTPRGVVEYGELRFQFVDGYGLHCHVFRANGVDGEPTETDEAIPLWTAIDAIPYDRMWSDDRLWLPLLLDRKRFHGRFVFDGDRMVDHDLVCLGDAHIDA